MTEHTIHGSPSQQISFRDMVAWFEQRRATRKRRIAVTCLATRGNTRVIHWRTGKCGEICFRVTSFTQRAVCHQSGGDMVAWVRHYSADKVFTRAVAICASAGDAGVFHRSTRKRSKGTDRVACFARQTGWHMRDRASRLGYRSHSHRKGLTVMAVCAAAYDAGMFHQSRTRTK